MADEKVYMVNLRDAFEKPRGKRGPKAIDIIRAFIARHMKADLDNVKISGKLNEIVWARGIQKPPRRVKVKATRDGPVVSVYHIDEKIVEKKEKKAETKEKKKEPAEAEKKASEGKAKAEKAAQKVESSRAEASAKKEEKDDRKD
jgi:large subunit ribosomal protein L31e